ncbi:hypothetical protein [Streptomyces sp. KL116D]|uniref:hypothetical protein n=1 Tax=Streptomyces sp. KL116D TaxID=3045152 RepID=UPI003556B264
MPELLALGAMADDHWGHLGRKVVDALRGADEYRARLVHALAGRYVELDGGAAGRRSIVALLGAIGEVRTGEPGGPQDLRPALIRLAAEQDVHYDDRQLLRLAELELADGHELPAPGSSSRSSARTCLTRWRVPEGLGALVRRLTDPVLNPGEAWADAALADVAERGTEWRELLAHARTASAARPPPSGTRPRAALIEPLDTEAVRERLTHWLRLVGRPRTRPLLHRGWGADPNATFDAYNTDALRGLTWILALLPAHADTRPCPRRPRRDRAQEGLEGSAGQPQAWPTRGQRAGAHRRRSRPRRAGPARHPRHVQGRAQAPRHRPRSPRRGLGLTREEIEELAVPAYG